VLGLEQEASPELIRAPEAGPESGGDPDPDQANASLRRRAKRSGDADGPFAIVCGQGKST